MKKAASIKCVQKKSVPKKKSIAKQKKSIIGAKIAHINITQQAKPHIKQYFTYFIMNIGRYDINNCIIHYCNENSITTYDPLAKTKANHNVPIAINPNAESISYGQAIFIIGGDLIDTVYEANIRQYHVVKRTPMRTPRYVHSLCAYQGFIYSIGGSDGNSLSDCEKYSVKLNRWEKLPDLIQARSSCAVFANKNTLYAFCGYFDSYMVCSLERIVFPLSKKWERIPIGGDEISGRGFIQGISLRDDVAIVFGGSTDREELSEAYLLTLTDGNVNSKISNDLKIPAGFLKASAPVLLNKCVYAVDCDKNIHIMDFLYKWGIEKCELSNNNMNMIEFVI